ncbi:pyridoxamine 5'-phosphate oxidase [Parafilimonas terrae]|uniref:Pyridoxine/pyridoxamine 5'-phosphate oxidase n=1 Tax=Parafilimonas terrae TaxID=1465490 RepID=A0A1I5UV50_9BACT|nr:pyridoxamine 5'-phosphate oxidase [Parafilimonas terrae]SFP99113.1 Pyridoxamine 5'-phosphate oxidase [Parafilimonas terrae]
MNTNIADIRKDYSLLALNEDDIATNPIEQFSRWWNDAMHSEILEVNAMTLSTATKDGRPSARIVLLKGFDENGFVFFTNYNSRKGNELAENPFAALTFFWKEIERQVRIEGTVEKTDAAESDAYFFSRPQGSRIGAWASPQSTVIKSRDVLEENVARYTGEFKNSIPRPPHWGGYRVMPLRIEFWQGRSSRLHDRISYTKTDEGSWKAERLAP